MPLDCALFAHVVCLSFISFLNIHPCIVYNNLVLKYFRSEPVKSEGGDTELVEEPATVKEGDDAKEAGELVQYPNLFP